MGSEVSCDASSSPTARVQREPLELAVARGIRGGALAITCTTPFQVTTRRGIVGATVPVRRRLAHSGAARNVEHGSTRVESANRSEPCWALCWSDPGWGSRVGVELIMDNNPFSAAAWDELLPAVPDALD